MFLVFTTLTRPTRIGRLGPVDLALFAGHVFLALVLLASGGAKLFDRRGTADGMRSLGIPGRAAAVSAVVLPVVELCVGVGLIIPATSLVSAWCALGLFGVFTSAAVFAVARGKDVSCHCFGRMGESRLDARALARNAGLTTVALFVALAGEQAGALSD